MTTRKPTDPRPAHRPAGPVHAAVLSSEPDMVSIRDGRLFVDDVAASELVERCGSPLFAYSETQLRTNTRRFLAAMAAEWPDGPVDVLPAFKANPMMATRRVLSEEGAGADIYSPGELEGALRAGVEPALISVNGGGKDLAHIRRCVEAGVRITVEDVDEIDLIQEAAAGLGTTAKIRFRVKPAMPNLWRRTDFSQMSAPIDLGIQVYKSGIPPEYLVEMGRRVFAMPNVELVGLHLHVGRHHPTAWYWKGAMRQFGRLLVELSRAWDGWHPQEIDCGGGFPSSRDPMNKETPRSEFLVTAAGYPVMVGLRGLGARAYHRVIGKVLPHLLSGPEPVSPPPIEELLSAAITTLRRELAAGGVPTEGVRLQMEPGRWLHGNTAVHLTRVRTVKRQTEPMPYSWVLTDTTQFFLAGGAFEHNRHPVVVADRADAPATTTADVVGHSCFADLLVPAARLPHVERGDVVALLETGAYQESSASNFNALPRPATVLVSGTEVDLIRRAETVEDVWARDVVPDRLEGAVR
ncbi:hypothetical protein P1P68_11360 [Streptomyces scabiei]|uniref:diaminopimelate decarboxylase family protein n=1 Tax=Streptomyces scabiei TaxID=1930 RepID=UPI00298F897F|nr:hypothetical protein [Streptomyces scabiei]MDW8805359.1 hypothetical protein [Streptomyces scabiei]